MKEKIFFSSPPKSIGEITQKYSSLSKDDKYTIIPQDKLRLKKIILTIVTLILSILYSMFIYDTFKDDATLALSFIAHPFGWGFSFFIADFFIFREKNTLKATNYFIGTKGSYYIEVKYNFDNTKETLLLFDDILYFTNKTTITKIENSNQTKYYPSSMKIKYKIYRKDKTTKKFAFEFNIHYEDGNSHLDNTHPRYDFFKFLEISQNIWTETNNLKPTIKNIEQDVIKDIKPDDDELYNLNDDAKYKIPIAVLIINLLTLIYTYQSYPYYTLYNFFDKYFEILLFSSLGGMIVLYIFAYVFYIVKIFLYGFIVNFLFMIFIVVPFSSFVEPKVKIVLEKEIGSTPKFTLNGKIYNADFFKYLTIKSFDSIKFNGKIYKKGSYTIKLKDKDKKLQP